ncbi:MAG: nucleoside hydrolase [Pirellulaceae bacterium]|nr:nucleoside hydrolase [Pirellulaceae bacterium]
MSRKILLDCDPGIDDAIAVCFALFHTEIELVGLTACEGTVRARQANRNLESVIHLLDPPKRPRLGLASPCGVAPIETGRNLDGPDGLANLALNIELQHSASAEKVMTEAVRNHPHDVTLVCLGPLTNIASLLQHHPHLEESINRVVIVGGSVNGIGNVTPCAEFNMYFDPDSAQRVLKSATTKSLVPLDVSSGVRFDLGFLEKLPVASSRAGHFLRQSLPTLYRSFRQHHAMEEIFLRGLVGLMACIQPNFFHWEEMAADIETNDGLTRGMTIFDRRFPCEWKKNIEVATRVESHLVVDAIVSGLRWAGQQTI